MVQESILDKDLIFLMQTKSKSLKSMLSDSAKEKNIRMVSIETSSDLKNQQLQGQIISFIIGSDVEDPIQSAQRLHVLKNSAKIIILSETEKNAEILRDVVKFSPFLGVDVFCLSESNKAELVLKIDKILETSLQKEKYRAVIEETKSQITLQSNPPEAALNQNFINKLMDVAPIGIAIMGKKGKILGWNKEAAAIFKENEAQVLGIPLSRFFDLMEGYKLENFIRQNFSDETTTPSNNSLILTRNLPDFSKQILSFTAAHFTYADGAGQALILTVKDVTKSKQSEKELHELNASLEERVEERTSSLLAYQDQLRSLASKLSKAEEKERHRLATELHDNLGQMLALIKMKISSLKKYELPEDTAADIHHINKGVDEALGYTRHLMSDLKPPPSLNQKDIRVSLQWLAGKMEKHGLLVNIKDNGKPKLVDDEIRIVLVQCVRELLFNIINHAAVNEALVTVSLLEKELEIIVEDKGKGFNMQANHAFSKEGGFGLFNITERIDLLGGSVHIESAPDAGTRIKLRAPLQQQTEGSRDIIDNVSRADNNNDKIRVMLVDDHEMVRAGLKKIINEQDDLIVIAETSDGEQAIKTAEKTLPDIVVMDVNLPVMNGIETTKKLLEKMPGIRVIALSFYNHQRVVDSMRAAGATAYLTKNDAFETLCATIRSEAKLKKNN